MAVYWISFRIHEDAGYAEAYEALNQIVQSAADTSIWWYETTSFYVARSNLSIDDLATVIKGAIRRDRDLVVIGMPEILSGRVIGVCKDQDIFKLMPFMKKV